MMPEREEEKKNQKQFITKQLFERRATLKTRVCDWTTRSEGDHISYIISVFWSGGLPELWQLQRRAAVEKSTEPWTETS